MKTALMISALLFSKVVLAAIAAPTCPAGYSVNPGGTLSAFCCTKIPPRTYVSLPTGWDLELQISGWQASCGGANYTFPNNETSCSSAKSTAQTYYTSFFQPCTVRSRCAILLKSNNPGLVIDPSAVITVTPSASVNPISTTCTDACPTNDPICVQSHAVNNNRFKVSGSVTCSVTQ